MENNGNNKDTGLKIYQPLPSEVLLTLAQQSQSLSSVSNTATKGGEEFVAGYIQARTVIDIDDLNNQLKRHMPLKSAKPVKENKRIRNKKKVLTSIEKRKLGLHKLPKTGLKYKSFASLHKLWIEYMENFLDLENSTTGANQDLLYQRIAKADYHGCLLMVTRSKCPSYIGVKGIVVLETKNTFQIICESDELKIIPKRDSVFTFIISRWTFTLFGNHMNIRPSERASRKFKSRSTIDL